jgi:REP-associated tyrosine transposase
MARGTRRTDIYADSRDRWRFLELFADVCERSGWRCAAYCLMRNHFHLLMETPQPNLSHGMHRLNGLYAQSFNARHGFEGHVFERRFRAVLVDSEWHFVELCRYLPLNPVRAGLCTDPGEWPWSSYRATVGEVAAPRFLTTNGILGHFGPDLVVARQRFRAFVEDGRPAPAGDRADRA